MKKLIATLILLTLITTACGETPQTPVENVKPPENGSQSSTEEIELPDFLSS